MYGGRRGPQRREKSELEGSRELRIVSSSLQIMTLKSVRWDHREPMGMAMTTIIGEVSDESSKECKSSHASAGTRCPLWRGFQGTRASWTKLLLMFQGAREKGMWGTNPSGHQGIQKAVHTQKGVISFFPGLWENQIYFSFSCNTTSTGYRIKSQLLSTVYSSVPILVYPPDLTCQCVPTSSLALPTLATHTI